MATRAKFIVKSKTWASISDGDDGSLDAYTIELHAVNKTNAPQPDPADEDSVFGHYTPHGEVCMTIIGTPADIFVPGRAVYADFFQVEH